MRFFCDYCQDTLKLSHIVVAYSKKFCSPYCSLAWDNEREKTFRRQSEQQNKREKHD